jgi:hypothetical protein
LSEDYREETQGEIDTDDSIDHNAGIEMDDFCLGRRFGKRSAGLRTLMQV